MTSATYYIAGQEVSPAMAKAYFQDGAVMSIAHGYASAEDVEISWHEHTRSEEARELIFDISAIQGQGGLEIVIDYD